MKIVYQSIGIIYTPHTSLTGMPIQPSSAQGIKGQVVLDSQYADALKDLEGFSHIYLIYHLHKAKKPRLRVKPFLEDKQHGLFATRAPSRPNPIGLSVVRLLSIEGSTIHVENLDILDGTPLLDIKPFVGEMNGVKNTRIGWLENHRSQISTKQSDDRFQE